MFNALNKKLSNSGPGILVTAAFIGPGTVTACTLAGANYGYTLIWALVFATLATIILQEMSARLGTISQQGLGQSLKQALAGSVFKWPLTALLLVALYGGNAAYEAGNLAGASLGISAIFDQQGLLSQWSTAILAALALIILMSGSYRFIERVLLMLVGMMAFAFIATALVVQPNWAGMLAATIKPSIPTGSILTVIALVGTTVVPYNLFLHASAAKNKWHGDKDLSSARADTALSIGLGGLVAILIASSAAASIYAQGLKVQNAADMATQFEPLFGSLSTYLLGFGLFAAGLSSAITAPLATAYAVTEILGLKTNQGTTENPSSSAQSTAFRFICASIIVIGCAISLLGIKPIKLIVIAQFANGLLLPIVACFLLYVVNQSRYMGQHKNGWLSNLLGLVVVLFTAGLGLKSVLAASGFL